VPSGGCRAVSAYDDMTVVSAYDDTRATRSAQP